MIPLANHHASKVTARYSEMHFINLLETFCYLQPGLNKSLDMETPSIDWRRSVLLVGGWYAYPSEKSRSERQLG